MTNNYKDSFCSLPRSEVAKKMKGHSFFHDMDFGDFRTKSFVYPENLPSNYHLYPAFDLLSDINIDGMNCLDVGTFDGMFAFVLSKMGAANVDATCQHDLERFRLLRAYSGADNVAYFPKTDLAKISQSFKSHSYDFVSISAMLHHLLSPLEAIFLVRTLLKKHGLFLIEAAILPGDDPVLHLNTELKSPVVGAPTLWLPTLSALKGMLKSGGFKLIAERKLTGGKIARETNFDRVTLLAKAVEPSELLDRSEKLKEIHDLKRDWNPILDFKTLKGQTQPISKIKFEGSSHAKNINIWFDHPKAPYQAKPKPKVQLQNTCFKIGTNDMFMQLMHEQKDEVWNKSDTTLLAAKYPGEIFPDGMTWSAKQFANLFCLSYIKNWGLSEVLEIGAGFNLYFDNHLSPECNYSVLDDEGFYDYSLLTRARAMRSRDNFISGLLGEFSEKLKTNSFDCCFSVSVLEHVPKDRLQDVANDMYRIIRPGGWALHSIDVGPKLHVETSAQWLRAMIKSGFTIDEKNVDLDLDAVRRPGREIFCEPLSIIERFHHSFKDKPWEHEIVNKHERRMHTVLLAMQKPF